MSHSAGRPFSILARRRLLQLSLALPDGALAAQRQHRRRHRLEITNRAHYLTEGDLS